MGFKCEGHCLVSTANESGLGFARWPQGERLALSPLDFSLHPICLKAKDHSRDCEEPKTVIGLEIMVSTSK